jgi:hypothetical protein
MALRILARELDRRWPSSMEQRASWREGREAVFGHACCPGGTRPIVRVQ